jgi:hypothetical protein
VYGALLAFYAFLLIAMCVLAGSKALSACSQSGLDFSQGARPRGLAAIGLALASLALVGGLIALMFASTRLFAFESGPTALQWIVGGGTAVLGFGCILVGTRTRKWTLIVWGVVLVVLGAALIHPPSFERLQRLFA